MFVANLNCFETHVCTLRQTLTRGDHLQVGTFKSFTVSHCFILGLQAMRASRASQPPMAIPKIVRRTVNFWFSMILRCWLAGDIDPWFVGDMTWMSNMLFSVAFCNILIDCLSCRSSFAWRTVETNFYKGSSHTPNYTSANTYAFTLYSDVWHTKTDQKCVTLSFGTFVPKSLTIVQATQQGLLPSPSDWEMAVPSWMWILVITVWLFPCLDHHSKNHWKKHLNKNNKHGNLNQGTEYTMPRAQHLESEVFADFNSLVQRDNSREVPKARNINGSCTHTHMCVYKYNIHTVTNEYLPI